MDLKAFIAMKIDITQVDKITLYKLAVAHNDVTEALFTTQLFLKTVSVIADQNFQPLQDAIVIAYSRPFRKNRPYGRLDEKWNKFSDPWMQGLHEKILETRDTLIAHSDRLHRNVQIIPKGTSTIPGIPKNKDIAITVSTRKIALAMFPKIEKLCFDLGARLDREMFTLLDKLFGDKDLPPEPFDLL